MVATVLTTFPQEDCIFCDWIGPLANAENGNAAQMTQWVNKFAHVTGTFGVGGSVALQGSNDGTNWFALDDDLGVVIALTAAAPQVSFSANPVHIRAAVTAGDGTTALRCMIVGI